MYNIQQNSVLIVKTDQNEITGKNAVTGIFYLEVVIESSKITIHYIHIYNQKQSR